MVTTNAYNTLHSYNSNFSPLPGAMLDIVKGRVLQYSSKRPNFKGCRTAEMSVVTSVLGNRLKLVQNITFCLYPPFASHAAFYIFLHFIIINHFFPLHHISYFVHYLTNLYSTVYILYTIFCTSYHIFHILYTTSHLVCTTFSF